MSWFRVREKSIMESAKFTEASGTTWDLKFDTENAKTSAYCYTLKYTLN